MAGTLGQSTRGVNCEASEIAGAKIGQQQKKPADIANNKFQNGHILIVTHVFNALRFSTHSPPKKNGPTIMKANPGGNLDPDCVYGRENLINILWERLESQSILINAERRIGKTQILRKMQIQPQPGWKPLFKVLERVHSAQEFAELVYDDVQQFLGSTTRAKNFIQKVLEDNETDYIHHVVAGLRLMDADHYISRNTSGGFHFRFPLIQRWWKLEQGL